MTIARFTLSELSAMPRQSTAGYWTAVIGLVTGIAAVLRLVGTRGDLWLDEIWTLILLEPISWVGQIIWGINNDNNHFLNSIYLFAVGADASPMVQRGFSVVLGTMAVAAAGLASIRNGRAAALIAMMIFAVSYPMVHFGSEARGYAGLVLFSLVALVCLERELDRPDWTNRHGLGLAVGLGLLSHLTMAGPAAVLALWTFWVAWRRTGSLREAEAVTRTIFRPALAWALAIGAAITFGVLRSGFTVGGVDPFDPAGFVDGYGRLIRLLLGVPEQVPAWLCLEGAVATVMLAAFLRRGGANRQDALIVVSVIVLPAAMFAAHLPNLQFPRYYLFAGTMFLIFLADVFGRAWGEGGIRRALAVLALLAIAAGNVVSLRTFYENGRGHYAAAVARMAALGPFVYGSDHDFRTPMLVNFYARRQGVVGQYVKFSDWCRTAPEWLVMEDRKTQQREDLVVPECSLRFVRQGLFPAWGLSGWPWALYQRAS
jgi:hypothetical protein